MKQKFRSVAGDIDAVQIGNTYTHEHIYCDPRPIYTDETLALTDIDKIVKELKIFKQAGGATIVDGTASDYGRNPDALLRASQLSGVNIIATTGFYLFDFHPQWLSEAAVECIADHFDKELTEGMSGTTICAGQIKCAVSATFIHPREEKILRAAALSQKNTGAPIWIHHAGMMGTEIIGILEKAGADLTHVVLGHMDRNPDTYEFKRIAAFGSMMSIDNIARIYRYPIQTNVDALRCLLEMGCLNRVLLSADFGRTSYLESYGGGPGFRFLLTRFADRLRDELGLSQDEIDTLFIRNPQAVYAVWGAQAGEL